MSCIHRGKMKSHAYICGQKIKKTDRPIKSIEASDVEDTVHSYNSKQKRMRTVRDATVVNNIVVINTVAKPTV